MLLTACGQCKVEGLDHVVCMALTFLQNFELLVLDGVGASLASLAFESLAGSW